MKQNLNFLAVIVLCTVFFAGCSAQINHSEQAKESIALGSQTKNKAQAPTESQADLKNDAPADDVPTNDAPAESQKDLSEELPKKINIKMDFYPQAPYGDWSEPWQEACEEASVILATNYLLNLDLSKAEFKEEILKLVEWEKQKFGDYKHTSIEQTAQILKEFYQLNYTIHENPSEVEIKKIIAKGNPIVAGFAGKKLQNPYFSSGGPNYHMMVLKGYNKSQIITLDVGTKRGNDFKYSFENIIESLHDWHDENIEFGAKKIIEVYK